MKEVLQKHVGTTIGINIERVHHIDAVELLAHLNEQGYTGFKIINQYNFKPLSYYDSLMFNIRDKIRRTLNNPMAHTVRMGGRDFTTQHSSGPMGEATAGVWLGFDQTMREWQEYCNEYPRWSGGWWDLHARLP